jgi:hypothetical protein
MDRTGSSCEGRAPERILTVFGQFLMTANGQILMAPAGGRPDKLGEL